MKYLTQRHYGHHIDKGCSISIPESGYAHSFPEPQRNVWKSRKWTAEEAEAQQEAEYWLRLVDKNECDLFNALKYAGFTLSKIDGIMRQRV